MFCALHSIQKRPAIVCNNRAHPTSSLRRALIAMRASSDDSYAIQFSALVNFRMRSTVTSATEISAMGVASHRLPAPKMGGRM